MFLTDHEGQQVHHLRISSYLMRQPPQGIHIALQFVPGKCAVDHRDINSSETADVKFVDEPGRRVSRVLRRQVCAQGLANVTVAHMKILDTQVTTVVTGGALTTRSWSESREQASPVTNL